MKSKNSFIYKLKNTSFGQSNFYIFEYALMLGSLSLLLGVILNMIKSFCGLEINIWSFYNHNFDTEATLLGLFAVSLPIFVIFLQRTAEAEHNNPFLLKNFFRKALLGAFLGVLTIVSIFNAVALLNSLLNFFSIDILSGNGNDYKESIYYLLSAILLTFTAWAFTDSYSTKKTRRSLVMHNYLHVLLIASLVTALAFIIFPFSQSRLTKIDMYVSEDLTNISSKINDYYIKNQKMPEGLNSVDLTTGQNLRANNYKYSYELKSGTAYRLCADFLAKSDRNFRDHFVPMSEAGDTVFRGSSPSIVNIGQNDNPYIHEKGKQCFDMMVSSLAEPQSIPASGESEGSTEGGMVSEGQVNGNTNESANTSDSSDTTVY